MDAITITFDIFPPKAGKPATVNVGAAAGDGTPLLLSGSFADRHRLMDEAYGAALKRGAKAEARKAAKPAGKGKKHGKAGGGPAFGKPGHLPSAEAEDEPEPEETGPIGPVDEEQAAETIAPEAPAELPVIEGDDDKQLELEMEGQGDD